LNTNNSYSKEITALLKKGVEISACNITVRTMQKFKKLPIIEGVAFVPMGVVKVFNYRSKAIYIYTPKLK